jgi:hypothetical protein
MLIDGVSSREYLIAALSAITAGKAEKRAAAAARDEAEEEEEEEEEQPRSSTKKKTSGARRAPAEAGEGDTKRAVTKKPKRATK